MPSIGDAVIDGYKQTSSWYDSGVDWLEDVQEFYRERAAIEREASAKLASLASKYHSKKAQGTVAVSVGTHPLTTPGSLECMTMESWTTTLNQTEQIAAERKKLSEAWSKYVVDELGSLHNRSEQLSRTYKRFHETIEERRDKTYQSLKRAKSSYDSSCESMESARAKNKRSLESKETDMYNAKNQYIIQINIANRIKDKYFHDDTPEMLDSLQLANEARVAQTNRILTLAGKLEQRSSTEINKLLDVALKSVADNEPSKDTAMFIEHNGNAMQWRDPTDFFFEPSPIWHDNDQMAVKTQGAILFVGALLNEAKTKSVAMTMDSQRAMQLYENARNAAQDAKYGEITSSQALPILQTEATSLLALVAAESSRLEVEVEIEAIEVGTANVDMSHIPDTRVKVSKGLFGKKKEVVRVVNDGRSVHSQHGDRSLGLTSLLARTSLGRSSSAATGGSGTRAVIMYDFTAGNTEEMSVTAGENLELIEGDDGSGWVRLSGPRGQGLVPATSAEILFGGKSAPQSNAPPPPPSRGSQDTKVVALYDFEAGDETQLTIHTNDVITVVRGDEGGWTTGIINGKQGIFPTSYTRPA